jgi:hypothetical protein
MENKLSLLILDRKIDKLMCLVFVMKNAYFIF